MWRRASLSNWREILANDFRYIGDGSCDSLPQGPCGEHAWELSAEAPALTPTLELFKTAKGKGIAVFFITGRNGDDETRAATEKNLHLAGYEGWTGLIMRPPGSHTPSAATTRLRSAPRSPLAALLSLQTSGIKEVISTEGMRSGCFACRTPFMLFRSGHGNDRFCNPTSPVKEKSSLRFASEGIGSSKREHVGQYTAWRSGHRLWSGH
jgi:hypothetical protein